MMERREVFKIFAAALAAAGDATAQHSHGSTAAVDIANYRPRFFSDQPYKAIDDLTEIIIPADEQSPGAHAAGVRFYIDTVLYYAEPAVQERWRTGLAAIDDASHAQFATSFGECSAMEKERLVAFMARNEKAPRTDLERFFPILKEMTLEAFTLSEVGMKEYLGYQGNRAIQVFAGCTHPEHQR